MNPWRHSQGDEVADKTVVGATLVDMAAVTINILKYKLPRSAMYLEGRRCQQCICYLLICHRDLM